MRQINLPSGQRIVAVELDGLPDLICQKEKAFAVLANVDEPFGQELVGQLVELRELGCERFLCSGAFSEHLHDAIDGRLFEVEGADEVMTTVHKNDEPIDDVVALFVELGAGRGSLLQIYGYSDSSRSISILVALEGLSGR